MKTSPSRMNAGEKSPKTALAAPENEHQATLPRRVRGGDGNHEPPPEDIEEKEEHEEQEDGDGKVEE